MRQRSMSTSLHPPGDVQAAPGLADRGSVAGGRDDLAVANGEAGAQGEQDVGSGAQIADLREGAAEYFCAEGPEADHAGQGERGRAGGDGELVERGRREQGVATGGDVELIERDPLAPGRLWARAARRAS
jgi:hypothetical protein